MNRENRKFLAEVFYKYWMKRVPMLDEFEAIDHLEWELRNMNMVPYLKNGTTSAKTKRQLKAFLKQKGVKTY